jgi:hypothetical protein
MPTAYKILGQVATSATTSTDLVTVAASAQVVVSSIVVCNRDSAAATYRISCASNGDALANQQYIAYDVTVGGNDSTIITIGATLDYNDKIRVYASTANLSFTAFGSELT